MLRYCLIPDHGSRQERCDDSGSDATTPAATAPDNAMLQATVSTYFDQTCGRTDCTGTMALRSTSSVSCLQGNNTAEVQVSTEVDTLGACMHSAPSSTLRGRPGAPRDVHMSSTHVERDVMDQTTADPQQQGPSQAAHMMWSCRLETGVEIEPST